MKLKRSSKISREWLAPASGSQPLEPHGTATLWSVVSNCLCPPKWGNLKVIRNFELMVTNGEFNEVLDFLEILIDEILDPYEFANRIAFVFEKNLAPYRLALNREPFHFFPVASQEQAEATQQSLETLIDHQREGASSHLRQAADHIKARQFSDSIADSILTVESVARMIDPNANRTLAPALNSLERAGILRHPALKGAFSKLYGYTNDEEGIRHALSESDSADVDLDEAIFMYGVCASFAAYLSEKHKKMQERDS